MFWKPRMEFNYLIAGLGNPGRQYVNTRHNVGFRVVQKMAAMAGGAAEKKKGNYYFSQVQFQAGQRVVLVRPLTFMNRSGLAVRDALKCFRLTPAELLVVYDDLDLPVGTVRVKPSGSSGGHRGMASIIQCLGTDNFPRLRIGISRPPAGKEVQAHVLGNPAPDEAVELTKAEERAAEVAREIVTSGLETAMNKFN